MVSIIYFSQNIKIFFLFKMDNKILPNQKVILLIGDSGHGKSSFINCIANKRLAHVHDRLDSCTITP